MSLKTSGKSHGVHATTVEDFKLWMREGIHGFHYSKKKSQVIGKYKYDADTHVDRTFGDKRTSKR